MDFQYYKLVNGNDGYTLIVYLDSSTYEFAKELGESNKHIPLKQSILKLIKEKYPHVKITSVKVMMSGMLIGGYQLSQLEAVSAQTQLLENLPYVTYTVKSGDTLYLLSKRFGTTVNRIKELNQLTTENLYVAQQLKLPLYSYTVASGDLLWKIAERFHTTVERIKSVNQLTSDHIYVGQSLYIPAEEAVTPTEPETISYTVVAGDTLYLIAKKHQTTVDAIKQKNHLTTDSINVGQVLEIPETTPIEKEPETNKPEGQPSIIYIVAAGDTLYKISQKFGVTVQEIQKMNNLTTTNIYVGQKLTIPTVKQPEKEIEYVVVSGDTLSAIAKKFQSTVAAIKERNNLKSDMIYVNQHLFIPQNVDVIENDTIAPEPPIVQLKEVINQDNQKAYKISGKTEAGALIEAVLKDGEKKIFLRDIKADANGNFQASFDVSSLKDGSLLLTVTAIDQAGNKSEAITKTILKDTKVHPPSMESEKAANQENAAAFRIMGKAEPNATISISVSDGSHPDVKAETNADASGNYRLDMDVSSLNDGNLMLKAIASDKTGNKSEAMTKTIIKDTKADPPTMESEKAVNLENAAAYIVTGKAEPKAIISLSVSDGSHPEVKAETTADAKGNYRLDMDLRSLNDGNVTFAVTAVDQAGNKSEAVTKTIIKDTKTNSPVIDSEQAINQETAKAYVVTGKAEPNAAISLSASDGIHPEVKTETTADVNGNYEVDMDVSSLKDGNLKFTVTAIDQAGNKSQAVTKTIIKDTKTDSPLMESEKIIDQENAAAYIITGKAEPKAAISLSLSDESHPDVISETTADASGNYRVELDASSLNDGNLMLTATAVDQVGNKSQAIKRTIIKDTEADPPVIESEKAVNQETASAFRITGKAEPNAAISLSVSDRSHPDVTAETTADANGNYEVELDVRSLNDGKLMITAFQTDERGNVSEPNKMEILKDIVSNAPVVQVSQLEKTIYRIKGTGEPNAVIEAVITKRAGSESISKQVMANENGMFNLEMDIAVFGEQKPFITITQTDPSGNQSEKVVVHISSYVVSSGDTLWKISKRFNTTVDEMVSLNKLESTMIYVGQELKVPVKERLEKEVISEQQAFNLGYLYFGDSNNFIDAMEKTNGTINVVSPTYFDLNADGSLKLTHQVDRHFVELMHNSGIRVVPFLSNHWDRALGELALDRREALAQEIAHAIQLYNLDGIHVDIENVTHEYRDEYTDFVRILRQKLPEDKEVSTA